MTHSMRGSVATCAMALLAGCGGSGGPCKGVTGRCIPFTAGVSTEDEIETAF